MILPAYRQSSVLLRNDDSAMSGLSHMVQSSYPGRELARMGIPFLSIAKNTEWSMYFALVVLQWVGQEEACMTVCGIRIELFTAGLSTWQKALWHWLASCSDGCSCC